MPDPPEIFIKKAGATDAALVGEILSDAFSADPVGKWISPKPEYPRWCWPMIVPFLLPHNEVYIASNGLGAALLEHVLKKCDRLKTGVYLENSDSLNLKFHQRYGFKLQNEVTLPHNGPSLWLMYREPILT